METKGRGHAIELAAQAVETGADLVVALGGDGTDQRGRQRFAQPAEVRPDLPEPRGGTRRQHECVRPGARIVAEWAPSKPPARSWKRSSEGRTRRVGLEYGRRSLLHLLPPDSGIDAAAVERVEAKRAKGKRSTHSLYLRSTVNRFYLRRPRDRGAIPRCASPPPGLSEEPRRRLRRRSSATPIRGPTSGIARCGWRPDASFDLGLDVLALTRLNTPAVSTLRAAGRFFARRSAPAPRQDLRSCCTTSPS